MAEHYSIRVRGHLDQSWSAWFDDLAITNEANGEAVLTGPVVDQAALHGLLAKVRDLGLPLIAVQYIACHGARASAALDGEAERRTGDSGKGN
jgi:hypothetical protein